jgi:hypothetical protein
MGKDTKFLEEMEERMYPDDAAFFSLFTHHSSLFILPSFT